MAIKEELFDWHNRLYYNQATEEEIIEEITDRLSQLNINQTSEPIYDGMYRTAFTGGVVYLSRPLPHNNTQQIGFSESKRRREGLEHGDYVQFNEYGEIIQVEPSNVDVSTQYVDVRTAVKKNDRGFYIDEDHKGNPLPINGTRFYINDSDVTFHQMTEGDMVTVRFDTRSKKVRASVVWTERRPTPLPLPTRGQTNRKKPKIKKVYQNEHTFDLEGRTIGIIGGGQFQNTWEKWIQDNNGIMLGSGEGSNTLNQMTAPIKRIVEQSDLVLLAQNMINHPLANAVRQYAKEMNQPCESFVGFSANQIFKTIEMIDGRLNNKS